MLSSLKDVNNLDMLCSHYFHLNAGEIRGNYCLPNVADPQSACKRNPYRSNEQMKTFVFIYVFFTYISENTEMSHNLRRSYFLSSHSPRNIVQTPLINSYG